MRRATISLLVAGFAVWTIAVAAFLAHVWLHGAATDKAFATILALPLWLVGATLLSLLGDDVAGV